MIRISKLSGEELCALDEKGLEDVSTKYGPTVKGLKRHIRTLTDASIYRQRLLLQNEELDDDQSLNNLTTGAEQGFFELQLLLIPWQRLDHPDMVSNYEKLRKAVEKASSKEVERLLRIPIHPDMTEADNEESSKAKQRVGDLWSYLHSSFSCAIHVGDPEIAAHLLDAGADPNAPGRLKRAVGDGKVEIARLLLEARAHPDGSPALVSRASRADSRVKESRSEFSKGEVRSDLPLCLAIQNRDLPMIKLLLQSGCARDHIYKDGSTALMTACEEESNKLVKTLLQAGASVNKSDSDGQTPLMECSVKNLEMTKLMLDFGAETNSRDLQDRTALFHASGSGRDEAVQCLLQSRAEVDAADCRRRSPLWVAARNGHLAVVQTLIRAGARIDLTDLDGRSPAQIAKRFNHQRVFKFFKDDEVCFINRPASKSTVIKRQTKRRGKAAR
mmetsp:Transcript_59082/g.96419  ORF Transcript_59082/g.96419 Transcript_59082/m.96419 type:complete len:445 (+) Transcript_59082:39-1373(+)